MGAPEEYLRWRPVLVWGEALGLGLVFVLVALAILGIARFWMALALMCVVEMIWVVQLYGDMHANTGRAPAHGGRTLQFVSAVATAVLMGVLAAFWAALGR